MMRRIFSVKAALAAGAVALVAAIPAACMADTISNGTFALDIPDEVLESCTVETDERGISFYDTASKEARMGGFVGSLSAYESPDDYNEMPGYERAGIIEYPDGTWLDLVVQYPTDVQFLPDTKESYNKAWDAFEEIIKNIIPEGDGTFVPQDEVDTTAVYDDVLADLIDAISSQADTDALEEMGVSYIYSRFYEDESPLDSLGYAYKDLNGDGYDELLIGSVGYPQIYDLFGQKNGEAVHVFSGWERNSYDLVGREGSASCVRNHASSSAYMSENGFYILWPDGTELLPQVVFIYDGEKDPDNPWFIDYGGWGEPEPATEEEWNSRQENWGEQIEIEYTPLSAFGAE